MKALTLSILALCFVFVGANLTTRDISSAREIAKGPSDTAIELSGTRWLIDSIDGVAPHDQPSPVWVSFTSKGIGVGRGCHGLSARWSQGEGSALFEFSDRSQNVIAVHCANFIVAQEEAIARIIATAVRIQRIGETGLVLQTDSAKKLTLRRAEESD